MNCTNNKEPTLNHWNPCKNILNNFGASNHAVIVLNCQIKYSFPNEVILKLWSNAQMRLTVDGGTNRWLKWVRENNFENSNLPPPDLIIGDMDSIEPDALTYFLQRNSKIVKTPDQSETDFTKALRFLKDWDTGIDHIYVLGDTSGRFDQIMANINSLFKANDFYGDVRIYQLASDSITWLLSKGEHTISIPENLIKSQEWCALIPIGGPCVVTTQGFKWNLDNSELKFGQMVSSSNTYSGSEIVKIKTNSSLVWSMGIETLMPEC